MIEDGLFERFPVEAVYAHAQLARRCRPARSASTPGPMMAAADRITIDDHRQGRPRRACATQRSTRCWWPAHIITAAQSIVSRNVRPIDTAVVSLCAMQAGDLGRDERDPGQGDAGRHGAHLQPGGAGPGRAAPERARAAIAAAFGATARCTTSASIRPPSTRREALFAADVAERWSAPTMWCATWSRDGRRGLLVHAASSPGAYLRLGRAARRAAASCTTAVTISTTR